MIGMATAETESNWLFIRGLMRESAHWNSLPEQFMTMLPGTRVHCMDLPGNGKYWRQASPLSMKAILECVRHETRDILRQSEPLYLFSISLGSMLAIEWAYRYPRELAGMVLINTSLRGLSPFYRRLSWRCWPLLVRILMTQNNIDREQRILTLTSRYHAQDHALASVWSEIFEQHPVQRRNALRQLWAAACYRPPLALPAVPWLLLHSAGDDMVEPSCTKALCKQWQTTAYCHPTAGHDLPLDAPDWTIATVKNWLRIIDRDLMQKDID